MSPNEASVQFVVKVDVEDLVGDSECLECFIRKGQSIPEVARKFCEENGIAPGLQYLLEEHVHSSLAILRSQTAETSHRSSTGEDELETPTLKDLNMRLEQRLSRIATLRHVLKDSDNAQQVLRVGKILKTFSEEGAEKGDEVKDDKCRDEQRARGTGIHSFERLQSLDDLFKVHQKRRELKKFSSSAGSEFSDLANAIQKAKSPVCEDLKRQPTTGRQSPSKADLGSSPLRSRPLKRAPFLTGKTIEQIQQVSESQIAKGNRHPPMADRVPHSMSSAHLMKQVKIDGSRGTCKEEGKRVLVEGGAPPGETNMSGCLMQNSPKKKEVERSKTSKAIKGGKEKTGLPGNKPASTKGLGQPVKQAGSVGISDPLGIIHGLKKGVKNTRHAKIPDKTPSPTKLTEKGKPSKSPGSIYTQPFEQVTECSVPSWRKEHGHGHRTYQEIQEDCEIRQALQSKRSAMSQQRPASGIINDSFTKLNSIFDEPRRSKRNMASVEEQQGSCRILHSDLTPDNFEDRVLAKLKASLEEAKQEAQVGVQDLLDVLACNTEQRLKLEEGVEDQSTYTAEDQAHIDSVIKDLRRAMVDSEKDWEKESINVGTLGKVMGSPSPQRCSLKALVDPTILYEDNDDEEGDILSFSKLHEGVSRVDRTLDQLDSEADEDDQSSGRSFHEILRQEREAKAIAKQLVKDLKAEVLGSWR